MRINVLVHVKNLGIITNVNRISGICDRDESNAAWVSYISSVGYHFPYTIYNIFLSTMNLMKLYHLKLTNYYMSGTVLNL